MAPLQLRTKTFFSGGQFGPDRGGQFRPDRGGQFEPVKCGQFKPDRGGQLHRIFHLRAFMHNENVDNKLILLAGLEVNKRNYRAADSLLATIQELSDDHQKYYDIEHIHLKFLQNPVDSFPITQDSLFLEDMAIDTTWASGYARTLLILYYNRYLDTAASIIDTFEQYNRGQKIEENLHDEVVCNNPVVDEINITFTNFVNDRLQVELFDLNGKIAYTRTVKIADNNLKLNVNMLNKGQYILRIENSLHEYPAKLILKL